MHVNVLAFLAAKALIVHRRSLVLAGLAAGQALFLQGVSVGLAIDPAFFEVIA
jgi:hypothetical protein